LRVMVSLPFHSQVLIQRPLIAGKIENGVLNPDYSMINNSIMVLQGKEASLSKAHFLQIRIVMLTVLL
jgi:hypothetical protein